MAMPRRRCSRRSARRTWRRRPRCETPSDDGDDPRNPPKFSMKNPFSATHPRSSRAPPTSTPQRTFRTRATLSRSNGLHILPTITTLGPLPHLELVGTTVIGPATCRVHLGSCHFTASSEFRQLTTVTSAARKVVTVTLMSPAIRPRVSGSCKLVSLVP